MKSIIELSDEELRQIADGKEVIITFFTIGEVVVRKAEKPKKTYKWEYNQIKW